MPRLSAVPPAPAVFPAPFLPRRPTLSRAARAPVAPRAPVTHPAEVLKLQTFSFYQSISNFVDSLPNVREKDVKGLLFRKQQGTNVDFWLYEIDKAIQAL